MRSVLAGASVLAGTRPWFERITASAVTGALQVPPRVHSPVDGEVGAPCDACSGTVGAASAA